MSQERWRISAVVTLLAACGVWCQLVKGAAAVLDWEAAANGQTHVSRDAIGAALRDRLRGAPESVGSLQDILTQAQHTRYQQQQQQRTRGEAWTQSTATREPGEARRQRAETAAAGQDRVAPSSVAAAADTVERPYQYQYQQYHRGPNSIQDVLRQGADASAGPAGSGGGGDYDYPAPAQAQLPAPFGKQLNAGLFPWFPLPAGGVGGLPLMEALTLMQLLGPGAVSLGAAPLGAGPLGAGPLGAGPLGAGPLGAGPLGGGLGPTMLPSSLVPAATAAAAPPPGQLLALLMTMGQRPFPPIG